MEEGGGCAQRSPPLKGLNLTRAPSQGAQVMAMPLDQLPPGAGVSRWKNE